MPGDEWYEISGIQELNETIFSDTTVSSTNVSSSVRPSAAPPSPVPGRSIPLLASTPTIDLHQPVERIERKILYEIDNLRREKKDLVVERDILLVSRLNSCVIQNDDVRCTFYTGLSCELFLKLSLFLSTTVKISTKSTIPATGQLFLTLVKLRLNLLSELISHQAGMNVTTISRCFWKTVDVLYANIGFMVRWPDRETLKQTLPAIFKLHFPG